MLTLDTNCIFTDDQLEKLSKHELVTHILKYAEKPDELAVWLLNMKQITFAKKRMNGVKYLIPCGDKTEDAVLDLWRNWWSTVSTVTGHTEGKKALGWTLKYVLNTKKEKPHVSEPMSLYNFSLDDVVTYVHNAKKGIKYFQERLEKLKTEDYGYGMRGHEFLNGLYDYNQVWSKFCSNLQGNGPRPNSVTLHRKFYEWLIHDYAIALNERVSLVDYVTLYHPTPLVFATRRQNGAGFDWGPVDYSPTCPHDDYVSYHYVDGVNFKVAGKWLEWRDGTPEFGTAILKRLEQRGIKIAEPAAKVDPVTAYEDFIRNVWWPYLSHSPSHLNAVLKQNELVGFAQSRYPSPQACKQDSDLFAAFKDSTKAKQVRNELLKKLAREANFQAEKGDAVERYETFIRDVWWPYLRDNPKERNDVLKQPIVIEYWRTRFEDDRMREEQRKLFHDIGDINKAREIRNNLLTKLDEQEHHENLHDDGVDAVAYMVGVDLARTELTTFAMLNDAYTGRIWPHEAFERFTNPTTNEEPAMSTPTITFTTTKFITVGNGQKRDISQVSLDELFSLIEQTEAEIARLEAIKKKPKALQARIEALQAAIDELAAEADSR